MEQYGQGGGGMADVRPVPLGRETIRCAFQERYVLEEAHLSLLSVGNSFSGIAGPLFGCIRPNRVVFFLSVPAGQMKKRSAAYGNDSIINLNNTRFLQ